MKENPLPYATYEPGWPELLIDVQGKKFVRLRDGKTTAPFMGEVCLYGRVLEDGFLDRERQWVPTMGSIEFDIHMTGGTWMSADQLVAVGQTPIVIPPEPINLDDYEEKEESHD